MKTMADTEQLLEELRSNEGLKRRLAREALERKEKSATHVFIEALKDSDENVRWEAARGLITLQDPESAPALAKALTDEFFEVRWLAAEAMIELEEDALPALMHALIHHDDEDTYYNLKQGAHHILHALKMKNLLNEKALHLLDVITRIGSEISIPSAASDVLDSLV